MRPNNTTTRPSSGNNSYTRPSNSTTRPSNNGYNSGSHRNSSGSTYRPGIAAVVRAVAAL